MTELQMRVALDMSEFEAKMRAAQRMAFRTHVLANTPVIVGLMVACAFVAGVALGRLI